MGLATKSAELQKAIDDLIERYCPHEVMAALIDTKAMQQEMLKHPHTAWGFQYKWKDGETLYRQNWSVLILPSVTVYGEGPNKRPIG